MASSSRKCHCSVPHCFSNKQTHPYLSFHDFPTDDRMRAHWVRAIRRDEGPTFRIHRGNTYVCSRHFRHEDIYRTQSGLRRLSKSAVPCRFSWNEWAGVQSQGSEHEGTDESPSLSDGDGPPTPKFDHNYAAPPPEGKSSEGDEPIRTQEEDVQELHIHSSIQQHQPRMNRFCASDEDFHFYTRFPSQAVFLVFWESISPSASWLVYWSNAQKGAFNPHHSLPLIDECFMFFCRVAAGLKEKVLATMFNVRVSTVRRTVHTWTSYLYQVLGSMPIWMTRKQVRATMPDKFQHYCHDVRVIIDGTELHCETSSSLMSQSKTSINKSHTTFKGLIGIAPCGVITFISKLYVGPISDSEITRRANLVQHLQPGDGVMADKGFLIRDMLAQVGATLITSSFKNTSQLSTADIKRTQAIACLRILAERTIRRVREYHIWDTVVPFSLAGSIDQLWAVCCMLTNYQEPFYTCNPDAIRIMSKRSARWLCILAPHSREHALVEEAEVVEGLALGL